jgi:hypothetical protein
VGIAGAASAFHLPGAAVRLDSQFSRSGIVASISRCFYVCLGFLGAVEVSDRAGCRGCV